MAYTAPRKKKNLWDQITEGVSNVVRSVGGAADRVIPGDQSSWGRQPQVQQNAPTVTRSAPTASGLQVQRPQVQPEIRVVNDMPDSTLSLAGNQSQGIKFDNSSTGIDIPKSKTSDYVGYSMDSPKNKTILGKNAAWLLPKANEKTYTVNVGKTVNTDEKNLVTSYDNMADDVRRVYVDKVRKMAQDGNPTAQNTIQTLERNGKFKMTPTKFINDAAEFETKIPGAVARTVAPATAKFLNTAATQIPQVYYTGAGQVAAMTHNQEALDNAIVKQEAANDMFNREKGGLLNVGTFYDSKEARSGGVKTAFKRVGGGVAEAGTEIISAMMGGSVGKEIVENGVKTGLRRSMSTIAKNFGVNALQGGTNAYNKDATPEEIAKSAAISGTAGTVMDIALGTGFAAITSKVHPNIANVIADSDPIAQLHPEFKINNPLDAEINGTKIPVKTPAELPVVSVKRADGTLEQYQPKSPEEAAFFQKKIDDNRLETDGAVGIAGKPDTNGDVWHISSGEQVKKNYTPMDNTPVIPDNVPSGNNLDLGNDARARFANRTPEPDVPLHEKYGVKQETADRLVRDYGPERAEGALRYMDEASSSGTVRSRDGFAVGQAQKMFGKVAPPEGIARVSGMSPEEAASLDATAPATNIPTKVDTPAVETPDGIPAPVEPVIKTTTPEGRPANVNAVTGEVQSIPTQIRELPDHNTATVDDLPTIKSFSENFDNGIEVAREAVNTNELAKMQSEIVDFHRNGTPVSPESQKLYDTIFKKPYEEMGLARRSSGGTVEDYYLHETRGMTSGDGAETGYGFVDTVNQNFGANMSRQNKIPLDEMTDPLTALKEYKDQFLFDKYRIQREAQHYAEQGFVDPVTYVKAKNEVAGRLAAKVDKNVEEALAKGVDPEAVTIPTKGQSTRDELRELYKKTGAGDSYEVVNAPRTGYQAQTTRNIYKDLTMQDGSSVYETWGIKRFEDADAQGNHIYQTVAPDGIAPKGQELIDRLTENYGGVSGNSIDPVVERQMIDGAARRIERESAQNLNDLGDASVSSVEFEKLERDLASEQIRHFAERTDIPNKNARKVIDRIVELELSGSRRRVGIAEKLANKITTTLHLGALGLNPYSAAQNLTETSRIVGIFGPKTTAEAMADLSTGKVSGKALRHSYGVREDVIENTILKGEGAAPKVRVTGVGKKIETGMMAGFNATEGVKDSVFLRAAEIEADKLGLAGRAKVSFVRTKFEDAFKLGELGSIWGTKNPIGRLALQFGQYPIKDWGLTFAKIRDLTVPGKQAEAGKYLTGVFGAKAAYLAPMYLTFGAGLQQMFSLSSFRGGPAVTIPIQVIEAVKSEQDRVEAAQKYGKDETFNWGNVWKDAGQKTAPIVVPGGNYLINKVGVQEAIPGQDNLKIGNTNVFRQDTAIGLAKDGYNASPKGRARFAAPDDALNWARTFLGGAYNNDNARDQFGTTVFSMQIPGSKSRPGSTEGLFPVDRVTQQRIDTAAGNKDIQRTLIENNHKSQRGYSELKKGLTTTEQQTFDQLNGRSDVKLNDGAKNELYWQNPKMLDVMNKYAALQRELDIPSDPLYNLAPEKQRVMLHYLDEETASKDKKATKTLNPWIKDVEDARGSFFDSIKDPNKVAVTDTRIPDYPEATGNLKTTMDQYFAITDAAQKGQFMGEHPEISEQLSAQAKWVNEKRKARGAPEFDMYPAPDTQTKKFMDQYNALPKGDGPLKKDGSPSSPARSAWIQAHPNEFALLTSQWNKQNLWSLQNGLSESVYKGIDPKEGDIKDIVSLAKSLGMDTGGGGFSSGGGGGGGDASGGSFGSPKASGIGKVTVKVPSVKIKAKGGIAKKVHVKRGGKI